MKPVLVQKYEKFCRDSLKEWLKRGRSKESFHAPLSFVNWQAKMRKAVQKSQLKRSKSLGRAAS